MKTKNIFSFLIAITLVLIISCENDKDTQKPTITNLEVGHNDSIHAAEPIHLEFEAEDNEVLDYYRIIIYGEEHHDHKSATEFIEWDFDSTFYNDFTGLKNATVHHHLINVHDSAKPGAYHFHLTVADKAGNTLSEVKELELTAKDDHDYAH